MPFLIVLAVVAATVAIVALQNGHAVTVSFLFWRFDASLALVILGATMAGLVIGAVIGFARALRRWSRKAGASTGSGTGRRVDPPRSEGDRRLSPP